MLAGGCASAGGSGVAQQAAITRGGAFVARACAGCHATGPEGDSPDARAPRFRDLGRRVGDQALEGRLAEISRNGHVQMPPIFMSPAEVKDVAAYVRALEQTAGGEAPPPQRTTARDAAAARA
jgi:mono/diheme cytochrome c family protein